MTEVLRRIDCAKEYIYKWKSEGLSIGFVPTMGCLHAGHLSLIERSARENDKTVVSIFVNPAQFGEGEDFNEYPRDFEADVKLCREAGVDLIFAPDEASIYPDGHSTYVDVSGLTDNLCGRARKGHFRGVCTVLVKLFNILKPTRAYFGKKDAQQLCVVRRMVEDLNMDLDVVGCETVREKDGLAMSSRNRYLGSKEREAALCLSRALNFVEKVIASGERNVNAIKSEVLGFISNQSGVRLDYFEIVDACNMRPVKVLKKPCLCAIAAYVGKTRLIDNFYYE